MKNLIEDSPGQPSQHAKSYVLRVYYDNMLDDTTIYVLSRSRDYEMVHIVPNNKVRAAIPLAIRCRDTTKSLPSPDPDSAQSLNRQ